MKGLRKYFLLALLLVFTALPSVYANGWGDPLATDVSGDATVFGEDILAVDAQYANGFVYFRFQLNEPLMQDIEYYVLIGYDSNLTNGYLFSQSDIGPDLFLKCAPRTFSSDIILNISLFISGYSELRVMYNMTANNGTAMAWTDPVVIPHFVLHTFQNGSQAELAIGVDWTWVVSQMSGYTSDGRTLYLEFKAALVGTDWCPDRTSNTNDYITWDLFPQGIPGFTTPLAFFSLLALLALILVFERRPLKF